MTTIPSDLRREAEEITGTDHFSKRKRALLIARAEKLEQAARITPTSAPAPADEASNEAPPAADDPPPPRRKRRPKAQAEAVEAEADPPPLTPAQLMVRAHLLHLTSTGAEPETSPAPSRLSHALRTVARVCQWLDEKVTSHE
jgi:hypothetical protein